MQIYKLLLKSFGVISIVTSAGAQGNFVNLDFESANLSPVPPGQYGGLVPIANALPGWTAFLGTTQVTQVLQNSFTLGQSSIDILGPAWSFGGILDGVYTVVLQPGRGPTGANNVGASISQTGLVPVNAQSLQFRAETFSDFSVSLGGQNLSLVPLGTTANYTLYGASIPAGDAGQLEALTISVAAAPNTADYFDSFSFSPSIIPEPATWALLVCGAGAFSLMRRRNHESPKA